MNTTELVTQLRDLIRSVDYTGIEQMLSKYPHLANEGIPLDDPTCAKAHPLHRICDGVCNGVFTDKQAVAIADIFLVHGADINGGPLRVKHDSPLVAAASLHADETAIFYIERGADIHHPGCHGGTALHWAAWCGRDRVVQRLLAANADIHKRCIDFGGTPLLWAVHGYKFGGEANRLNQIECARMLIDAGADKTVTNADGTTLLEFLGPEDKDMRALLQPGQSRSPGY